MKNRALLMLTLAAGGVVSMPAIAQTTNPDVVGAPIPMSQVQQLGNFRADANGYVEVRIGEGSPFSTNALGTVFENTQVQFANSLGSTHIIDDYSFVPGPWATQTGRAITTFDALMGNFGPATTRDMLVTFWDEDDVNYNGFTGNGTNMIRAAAVPLAAFRIAFTAIPAGPWFSGLIVTPATPIAVPDGDAGIFIQYMLTAPGGTTPQAFNGNGAVLWGVNEGVQIGSNIDSWGRDRNFDGIFIGNPLGAPAVSEHNSSTPKLMMPQTLVGDLGGVTLPTPRVNVGCLTDGTTVRNQATDSLTWYEVCLNAGATDATLSFLDIDTEGSAANLDIALYNSEGIIVGVSGIDANDGSGENAQLSFGIGRRDLVGDGLQYDGRDGELPTGTYFLGVGPAGTVFTPAFNVAAGTTAGTAGTINFRTNVNGTAPAASVPPVPTTGGLDFALPFVYGATEELQNSTGETEMPQRRVNWAKFSTVGAASAATGTYLDIDANVAGTDAITNGVFYLFDNSGNVVAFDNDTGPGLWPQLSFGSTAPRFRGTNTVPFAGENGDLPEGTYYFAFATAVTQDIAGSTSDRWHVRGTNGSTVPLNAAFFTGTAVAAVCDTIDFNNDGLFPDDNDLVQFLSVLAGGPCDNDPNCNDIDFNNDGLFPDDSDLITFLRVLAGGECAG